MSWLYSADGAGEGTRTPTTVGHQNLNLARLPIPPHPRIDIVKPLRTARSIAFKPAAKGLDAWNRCHSDIYRAIRFSLGRLCTPNDPCCGIQYGACVDTQRAIKIWQISGLPKAFNAKCSNIPA